MPSSTMERFYFPTSLSLGCSGEAAETHRSYSSVSVMDLLFSFIVKCPSKCFSDYIKTSGLLSLRKERLVNTMWAKVHFKMLDAG